MSFIICAQTGTILNADHCFFVAETAINEEAAEILDCGSDSEIAEIAEDCGSPLSVHLQALDAMADLLNASDWSSDHLNAVADLIRMTGRTVADL